MSVSLVEAGQNSALVWHSIASQAVSMADVSSKSKRSESIGGYTIRGNSVGESVKSTEGGETAADRSAKKTGSNTNERNYRKDCSVLVNVGDNQSVKATEIIKEVIKLCGEGQLYACVPKAGNMYMLTLKSKMVAELVLDGIRCGEKVYPCTEVTKNSMVVSFMNVDPYVPDKEITDKLEAMNVEKVGKIRRLHYADTEVENGNRVCRVKLPPTMPSLPYLMKLSDGETANSYRVIHDNQQKLCFRCNKPDHVFRDCPEFVCFRCNKQGHFRRQCKAQWCQECYSYECTCYTGDTDEDGNTETEKDDGIHVCESCDMLESACVCKCRDCGQKHLQCHCENKFSDAEMSQEETMEDENVSGETEETEKEKIQPEPKSDTIFGDFFDMRENIYNALPVDTECDDNGDEDVQTEENQKQKYKKDDDKIQRKKRSHGNEQDESYSKMRILQETETETIASNG